MKLLAVLYMRGIEYIKLQKLLRGMSQKSKINLDNVMTYVMFRPAPRRAASGGG